MRRVILSNITSSGASQLPSILSGVPGYQIEDIKISDVFLQQIGGGSAEMAARKPEERETAYPDPEMFGALPASGFFLRHVRNLEMSNIEIATQQPDQRPAFALVDVNGADLFRIRLPRPPSGPAFSLKQVTDFRVFGSQFIRDQAISKIEEQLLD
jgi:hypothetical protein